MSTKYPKPWYPHARGVWYVTIDGKQFNLGPDKDQAFEQYHRLMTMRLAGDSLAEILDAFLEGMVFRPSGPENVRVVQGTGPAVSGLCAPRNHRLSVEAVSFATVDRLSQVVVAR